MFCKDLFWPCSSLSSQMLFLHQNLLAIADLFMLETWAFGPPFALYLLLQRSHKEPWLDRRPSLNTSIFLSVWANVRLTSFWWISNRLIIIPVNPCLISLYTSLLLPLFLGSPLTAFFVFLYMYIFVKKQIFPVFEALHCIFVF